MFLHSLHQPMVRLYGRLARGAQRLAEAGEGGLVPKVSLVELKTGRHLRHTTGHRSIPMGTMATPVRGGDYDRWDLRGMFGGIRILSAVGTEPVVADPPRIWPRYTYGALIAAFAALPQAWWRTRRGRSRVDSD